MPRHAVERLSEPAAAERARRVCAQLQELLGRLDQAELSAAITDLRLRLCN